jgi:hypothetical protein
VASWPSTPKIWWPSSNFSGQRKKNWSCLKKGLLHFSFSQSWCKFKQKETILKLGNPLKSKSKFTKYKIGWGASPYQGFTLNSLWAHYKF